MLTPSPMSRDLVLCSNTTGIVWLENCNGSFLSPAPRVHVIDVSAHSKANPVGSVAVGVLACTTDTPVPQVIVGSPWHRHMESVQVYTPVTSATCVGALTGTCGYTSAVIYNYT